MRKISSKERKLAGNIYCPYCNKLKKVNAVWRKDGDCDKRFDVACEVHKGKIIEFVDEHLTEADLQTWAST